jgi:Inverse autotransporter, beta-domain
MRRVLLFLTFVSTLIHAEYWDTVIDVEGKVGNYRRGVDIVVWTALCQGGSDLLFVQGGGGYWRDHLYDGNVGLGYRAKFNDRLAWGVNAFVDITAAEHGETYWQGGLGGELMGNCWLVRANGYLPTNDRTIIDEWTVADPYLRGIQIQSTDTHCTFQEQAYRGFDIEAGAGFDLFCGQLWGFGTFFYFDANRVRELYGPRARLEYRLYDLSFFGRPIDVMIGGEYEWNQLHGHTGSATAWIRFPFGGDESQRCCSNGLCKQMGDPVIRERSIWIDRQKFHRSENLDLDQRLHFVSDKTSLADAVERAEEGDLFVVQGDVLDVSGLPRASWELKKDQGIFGSDVVTVRGGRELHLPKRTIATVKSTPTNTIIIPCTDADSTNQIVGVQFEDGLQIIKSKDPMKGDLYLKDLTASKKMSCGVDVSSKGKVTIEGGNLKSNGVNLALSGDAQLAIKGTKAVGDVTVTQTGGGTSSVTLSDVTGGGVEFIAGGDECKHTYVVKNCTLDGVRGIHLNTERVGKGSVSLEATGNEITSKGGAALLINGGSEGNLILDVKSRENEITLEGEATAFVGNFSLGGILGQLDWELAKNTIKGEGAALEVTALADGLGANRVELTENDFGAASGPHFETAPGFHGTLRVAMDENSCGDVSFIHGGNGLLQVEDLHTLSERNGSIEVTGSGPVQNSVTEED